MVFVLIFRAKVMHEHVNPKNGDPSPLVSDEVFDIIDQVSRPVMTQTARMRRLRPVSAVQTWNIDATAAAAAVVRMRCCLTLCCPYMHLQHSERLDSEIIYDRDFDYDYFGFKVGTVPFCR